jgi:ABC-2 type transport system permease protein
MRSAWNIAKKDLALRLRDRSVFIIGVVAPLSLAFIFNLVFGGNLNDVGEEITLGLGVANADSGPIGTAFDEVLASLVDDGFIELREFEDEAEARQAADEGDVGAVFILPAGTSDDMISGISGGIEVVGNVDAPTTTDIAGAIARQFSAGVARANLSVATALGTGVIGVEQLQQAAVDAGAVPPLADIGPIETEVRQLDSGTYFVAALSVFFMFFISGLSVTDMLEERREGTMARLLVAPISRGSILLGKSLTSVIIGTVSMTVLVVASSYLMGASWGPILGVAMLVGTATLAVVALMSMVGGFARTPEQAGNLQSIVAVTFAMLGGTFVPIAEGEGWLSTLQYVTPNAWFLRGLAEMATGDVAAGLPAAGVLAGMALVAGLAGIPLVKKLVHL